MAHYFRIYGFIYFFEDMIQGFYYSGVKILAKMAIRLFYHPIEINGGENIPIDSGRLIFTPNHQSAFLDAILVAIFSSRPIYFLTRADVFVFPFKYFLQSLNMMPVYRRRDGYKTLSKNEAVFETCSRLLQDDKPILLFPEASQELVHYLRPLSRGLSRIAIKAQKDDEKPLYIIPVGINFFHQLKGACKLILNFGKPIDVKQIMDQDETEHKQLNMIRDACSVGIKEMLLIPENSEAYENHQTYLNRNYNRLSFAELRKHIASGQKGELSPINLWYLALVSILSIPNLAFHVFSWLVVYLFVPDKTFQASIKLSLIMFIYPVFLLVCYLWICSVFGCSWAILAVSGILLAFYLRMRFMKYVI